MIAPACGRATPSAETVLLPARTGPFQVLAVSGSLRAASSNSLTLEAAAAVAPPDVRVEFYHGLAGLPQFNPDLDDPEHRPAAVREWLARIAWADAILISSPEYAHGVPGSLKNALDWAVSSLEFPSVLIALISPSPNSVHAPPALAETLRTMSGEIVADASVTIGISGRRLTLAELLDDPSLANPLRSAMVALKHAIARARPEGRRLVPAY